MTLEPAADLAMRSAHVADSAGAPIEAALSRTLAGRALAAAGDRDRAKNELEAAATALDSVGAQRYRDAAERELRQLGEHIHRRSQPAAGDGAGVDALTQRELEIARRIVDRQTNRQIAEELFLSPKTVETHMRNIFAKLGAELPRRSRAHRRACGPAFRHEGLRDPPTDGASLPRSRFCEAATRADSCMAPAPG